MGRVPSIPGGSAGPEDRAVANDYDSFAEAYSAETRPTSSMATTRVLRSWIWPGTWPAGGSSTSAAAPAPLFAALRNRGAIVTGIDKSAGMLKLARRRLGDDADLQVADLGSPLPFPDDTFDDVTASLVLHYLEDWGTGL
jgi:SAM-dependent methyltransferase